VGKLNPSEAEAFRLGAAQALREKAGTVAGQTSLLAFWKEPTTTDKLKIVFGNDYRKFQATLVREAQLKAIEGTARGSQTVARLGAAEEMAGTAAQLGGALASGAAGHPAQAATGILGAVSKGTRRLAQPEAARNELARVLLKRGPEAERELAGLPAYIEGLNRTRSQRAALAGALSSQANRE